jgi:hypothetical protein
MPHTPGAAIVIDDENVCRTAPARMPAIDPRGSTVAVAASDRPGSKAPSRREVFAIAAVLAATALTGAAAVAGLARRAPAAPTAPQIGQTITPATPALPRPVEPGG